MNKKTFLKIIIIISFFTISTSVNAQTIESKIDSLKNLLKTAKEDTNKVMLLRDIAWNYKSRDNKTAIYYAHQCLDIAGKIGNKLFLSKAYSIVGSCYYNQGDYNNAEKNYKEALDLAKETKNKSVIAGCFNSIGNVYGDKSNYAKSIEYYLEALKLLEQTGEKERIAHILINLGASYQELKNSDLALLYYSKALPLLMLSNNKYALSNCYANLGGIYIEKKELKNAEENFNKSREIYSELGDTLGISHSYYSLGMICNERKMYDKALDCFFTALKLGKQLNDLAWVAEYNLSIGQVYKKTGNYELSLNYLNQSLQLSDSLYSKFLKKEIHREFAETYNKMSNKAISLEIKLNFLKKAYNHFEKYSIFKDSTYTEESGKQIAEMQTKYDTEKKDSEIKLLNKDKEIQESNLKKQSILIFSFLSGFIIVLVFSVFLYRFFLQKKKAYIIIAHKNKSLEIAYSEINNQKEEITAQRDEIEIQRDKLNEQNEKLEEQKQEITDSINYAKRIQQAVMPDLAVIASVTKQFKDQEKHQIASPLVHNDELLDSFILFKPKDIVSGDFYWANLINEWLIVTVADCTGHGVPGAFMSMLGISFLNEIVRKKEVTKAGEVLDHLRESIIEALQQKGKSGEQKDGMDIAFCAINVDTLEMQFAGANNPVYIVTNTQPVIAMAQPEAISNAQSDCFVPRNDDCQLIELKGDKQPIGIHSNMQPFTNQIYQLHKGDTIYLMSDGYEDQFGGPNRKKFLAKNIKELLMANCQLPMADQKQVLETTINEWIGTGEQIDDITLLGLKI